MDGTGLVLLFPLLALGGFVVAVALVASARARDRRRRSERILAVWGPRGWAPAEPGHTRTVRCPPVQSGGGPGIAFHGPGPDGAPTLAFDWSQWITHGGGDGAPSQSERRHVVVASPAGGAGVAEGVLVVSRAGAGARSRSSRAARGAVPTGHPGFDAQFLVFDDRASPTGPAVTPALVAWLGGHPGAGRLAMQVAANGLVCWERGRLTAPVLERLVLFSAGVRAVSRPR